MTRSVAIAHLALTTWLCRTDAAELIDECATLEIKPARAVDFVEQNGVQGLYILIGAVRMGASS